MKALQIAPTPVHISDMQWYQFMHGCRNFLRAPEHCEVHVLHHYNGSIMQVQAASDKSSKNLLNCIVHLLL
jgi:hypothetical protein